MKLLFDQNLSPKLVRRLADLFPGSSHVHSEGLGTADDDAIWKQARDNGFVIVTKDADYNILSLVRGQPPKVIWLLLGNRTTSQVEELLRASAAEISRLESDSALGTIAIG